MAMSYFDAGYGGGGGPDFDPYARWERVLGQENVQEARAGLRGGNRDTAGIAGNTGVNSTSGNSPGFGGMFDFGALMTSTPGGTLGNTLLALQLLNSSQPGSSLFSNISIGER